MWNKLKAATHRWWRIPELEKFALHENIHRLRIIAIVGGMVNIFVSLFSTLDSQYSQRFFELEIYIRVIWIILSLVYIGMSTRAFVEKHYKWMQWIKAITVSLCLIFAALISGMPFADHSYLIVYYANVLLVGTLLYLSLFEIILLTLPSLLMIGIMYYSNPMGVLHMESNMVNVFSLTFFAFMMATMNYKLKGEQWKFIELTKRQNEELQYLSNVDVLTDMPNRRKINNALDNAINELLENRKAFGLLMIDIDFFKNYNDTYGHLAGDDCLIRVADALKGYAQINNGMIGRFGGEEFLLILPRTEDWDLNDKANDSRKVIEDLKIAHRGSIIGNVTISIGAVMVDGSNFNGSLQSTNLLELADKGLYQAKDRGRNCSVVVALNEA